ncbi:Trk system potassium transporter TrkA [Piscinibacter sakaiensis]|uniref:Trk system potassium uptake protein TrkA n=1 Tax=Piscinibacter sakaiensis TaxID=1547922 RepID=A0A0K8NZJ7_PISS1|nr:Trk system potassium transporter TrkA [Piscinibacter sakaiensis]GAP35827.1 Trk system potassium uptake protein TrkA [Piscinibacter sakaiensis]
MNIIILGAGRVGESVAESLVSERNDITVIDTDPQRLAALQERLDLRGVAGNGIQPSVLREAGAEDADMLIACAPMDETNLVVCKVAHDVFNIPTTIARVRSEEFPDGDAMMRKDGGFAVDRVICPEHSLTQTIRRLVAYPEALQVLEFAGGRVSLIAVRVVSDGRLAHHVISELPQLAPDLPMRFVAIYRSDEHGVDRQIVCDGRTRIEPGDEVFVLADTRDIRRVLDALRLRDQPVRRVMIAGGGRVGLRLARELKKECRLKIIEVDPRRCDYLTSQLPSHVLVLNGDSTDEDLLGDENVADTDLFLALTSDDEDNIMSCLLAKRMGARRVLALINRRAYADLVQGTQIDIALSPAQTVIGELLAHVRRGDVEAVYSLRRGAAEALEAVAHGDRKSSKVVGRRIEQIPLPPGAEIGALVRGEGEAAEVILPHHDTVIHSGDHVIVFLPRKRMVREVEKLFQVSATFF